ncbi:MAG: efflux RND transporter periplasmic adaptor subunit [Planctomycetota bacterium]
MSDVDLSALRMEETAPVRTRRPLGPQLAWVGLAVVVVAVAASFLWPVLAPARTVVTAPVRAADGAASVSRAATAEAAGWIEPDPFPIVVRPLVAGVLEELPVLEGHEVRKGVTVVGRLQSAELQAARDRAGATLRLREAQLRKAEVALQVAESLLEQKADLRLAESNARHQVTSFHARVAAYDGVRERAEAERDERRADLDGQLKLLEAGETYPVALARARAQLKAAEANVEAKARDKDAMQAELEQATEALKITQEVLADPRDLAGAVDNAKAAAVEARAEHDAASVELRIAERELGWATVKAPIDGVVLKLHAAPGADVGPKGDGILALYDPKRLQARIDVPLASVGGVRVGQDVEVRSEVLGRASVRGKVLRIQRESDLLKNTLQVKVRLIDPDPLLRPETLCRARFLAPAGEEGKTGPTLFTVPREAFRDGAVYVLAAGRARRVAVERAGEEGGDLLVRGALSVTQRVILDPVADGEAVKEIAR